MEPRHNMDQLLIYNKFKFDDFKRTWRYQKAFTEKNSYDYELKILSQYRFEKYFMHNTEKK